MATKARAVITTLAQCMSWMAPYAGGAIPSSESTEFDDWARWIQLGQQDAANRGFWRRFLVPETVTITQDVDYIDLPDDFGKVNGLYVLNVDGVDWNRPNNSDGQKLWVYMNPTDAAWRCKFVGFTPTATKTATLWYFYNPPLPEDNGDPLYLDGEMIGFYALKEKFRKDRQFGSLDDARIEYENRFQELLALEVIPSPQELLSWGSYSAHLNQSAHESSYYGGRGRSRA